MIQSAEKYPVSDLFGIDKSIKYVIPKYQREYVWGKINWEKLFDDILENGKNHFLGSIICVNNNFDALSFSELELIDGQQRFTTISLLYASLYENLSKYIIDNENVDSIKHELYNLKFRLVQKSDAKVLKLFPSVQRNNYDDYLFILDELDILKNNESDKQRFVGLRRIFKAFKYFNDRFQEIDNEGNKLFDKNKLLTFLDNLNSALLVKIEVSNHADAFTLFETINNTGVKLSAIDLIKNNMLSKMEKEGKSTIEDAFYQWKGIVEYLPDDSNNQERFLRHYYNSNKHLDAYKIEGISRASRGNIIKIYDKLIKEDVKYVIDDLSIKAEVYGNLIEGNFENSKINQLLDDLDNIGGTPSYSFLLYIFCNADVTEKFRLEILELLVKYFVRRMLTDTPPTRDLDGIFIELINLYNENQDNNIQSIINYLTQPSKYASDDLFEQKLSGNVYENNYMASRFILTKIEESENQTREIYSNFWERNKTGIYVWTVEHIFPQGINIPLDWINMVANGDKELAKEYRDKYVHTMGNLTLSGYNQRLSNLSFKVKRDRKDKKNNFIGFKNGLYLNRELATLDKWTIEHIKKRTTFLVEKAIKLFKI